MSGEDVAVQRTGRLGFRLATTRVIAQVIWPFLRPYFRLIVFGYVVGLVTVLIASGFGLWVDAYLDSILIDPDLSQKASLYVGFSAVAIGSYALLTFVHAYAFAWVSIEVIRKVRRRLFHTILVQGGLLIDDDSSGELQTRVVADTSALGSFLGRELPGLFVDVLTLIFSIAGALYVRPVISEEMFGAVFGNVYWLLLIPIALLIAMVMRKLQRLGKLTQKAEAQAGRYAGEAFRNWPVVHAFNQIDRECDRFGNAVNQFSMYSVASTRLKLAFDSMIFTVSFIGLIWFLLFVGSGFAPETILADVNRGELAAFVFFSARAISAFLSLMNTVADFANIVGRSHRITQLLNSTDSSQRVEVSPGIHQENLTEPMYITFDEVSYRYRTRDDDALVNVSFEIEPFKRTVLVGPSGSGKSTLFSALLRLIEPTSGRIIGNGIPASEYNIKNWRQLFGFVPQAEYLISGTVAENISYGVDDASKEDICNAASLAAIHSFIQTLPRGYDTDLGEVGTQLSGGQRQRINLARAILTRPSIYLLDEATNSLDPESEQEVQTAIDELSKTSTVLIIAHRLHTVRSADQIIVMENGRVVDIGDHETLMQREPLYQTLVRAYRY